MNFTGLRRLIFFGNLQGLIDGSAVGDVRHIQNLIHGHPHDGGGHQRNAGKAPALGVLGNIPIQLRGVDTDALDQPADILRLLGIGGLGIDRVLPCQGGKRLRGESLIQQLVNGFIRKAQLIGKMDGDFPRGVPYHSIPSSFSLF